MPRSAAPRWNCFRELSIYKRETARRYSEFFAAEGIEFFKEPKDAVSNYWLNAILLEDRAARDEFLGESNDSGVQTRPIWVLMHKLPP
jgi:dTDP-4-amino-4,6-dideoxygalactose transaminase